VDCGLQIRRDIVVERFDMRANPAGTTSRSAAIPAKSVGNLEERIS
jgi:hypothetical protein